MCVTVRPGNIHTRLSSLDGIPSSLFLKPQWCKTCGWSDKLKGWVSWAHAHTLIAVHCRQPCKGNHSLIIEGLGNSWEVDCTWGDFPPQSGPSLMKKARKWYKIDWFMRASSGYNCRKKEYFNLYWLSTVCWRSSSINYDVILIKKWY